MDYTSIAIGAFAIGFGLLTLVLRLTGKTDKLGKLDAMKQYWGEKRGNLIHLIGYTIVPIAAGIIFIATAIWGE